MSRRGASAVTCSAWPANANPLASKNAVGGAAADVTDVGVGTSAVSVSSLMATPGLGVERGATARLVSTRCEVIGSPPLPNMSATIALRAITVAPAAAHEIVRTRLRGLETPIAGCDIPRAFSGILASLYLWHSTYADLRQNLA